MEPAAVVEGGDAGAGRGGGGEASATVGVDSIVKLAIAPNAGGSLEESKA